MEIVVGDVEQGPEEHEAAQHQLIAHQEPKDVDECRQVNEDPRSLEYVEQEAPLIVGVDSPFSFHDQTNGLAAIGRAGV